MAKKTVDFNKSGAAKLPNDKPVVYKIKTAGGKTNYVGVAKKGRAQERIQEHLDAGKIPGAKVQIEQVSLYRRGPTERAEHHFQEPAEIQRARKMMLWLPARPSAFVDRATCSVRNSCLPVQAGRTL